PTLAHVEHSPGALGAHDDAMNKILRPAWKPWWRVFAIAAALTGLAAPLMADDLRDGRNALQSGHLDQALVAFERAAQQGQAEGRAGGGLVWLKRHQYGKALEA